jgi:hypothetical protein
LSFATGRISSCMCRMQLETSCIRQLQNAKFLVVGGVGTRSLAHSILRGRRGVLELRDGTRKSRQASLTHMGLHKTHTRRLVHSWSTFGARTSHEQHRHTRLTTARTWGETTTFPLIVYSTFVHGTSIQMDFLSQDFQVGVLKSPKLRLLQLWSPITLRAYLRWKCSLKKSCSSRRELSNDMWHTLCQQVNRVDS